MVGISLLSFSFCPGGKRLLAANFNQLPSSNSREESEEDDDDSLYLSAREDTDSTGFVSARGSTLDLHSSGTMSLILLNVFRRD